MYYFLVIANFIGISVLQKQLKSELYFREKNLDKIKSQVSESVKMLAISSNNDRMPHLKVIYFAIVKRPRRYFINNNICG